MKTRLLTFAALALALAACTNDEENLNDGPVAAQFTAAIGDNVTATTRVTEPNGMKTTASALPVEATPTCPM